MSTTSPQNRQKFFEKLGINQNRIVEVKQVHSSEVVRVEELKDFSDIEADGLITNKAGIYLLIKTADCIPLAFFDPVQKVVALIHGGWRGLDKGIITKTILCFQQNFGSKSEDLIVGFGPSIGPCCYRHISDVQQKDDPKWQPFIKQEKDQTFCIDLWGFARCELILNGVAEKNINNPKVCTHHSNQYFSHRKAAQENLNEGTFITLLGFKMG